MGTITRGYNRWPRNWPTNIPLHVRWPEIMEGVGAWPYQLKISAFEFDREGPPIIGRQALGTWLNVQNGVNTYSIEPSIADRDTGTLLERRVIRFPDGHYAIFSSLRFFGLNENAWESKDDVLDYSLSGQGQTLWMSQTRSILYDRFNPQPSRFFRMQWETLAFCGEEWPPP